MTFTKTVCYTSCMTNQPLSMTDEQIRLGLAAQRIVDAGWDGGSAKSFLSNWAYIEAAERLNVPVHFLLSACRRIMRRRKKAEGRRAAAGPIHTRATPAQLKAIQALNQLKTTKTTQGGVQ